MLKLVLSALLLSICAVSVCQGFWFSWNSCSPFWSLADVKHCTPCNLFNHKQVTLHVRNMLVEPTFQENVTLSCTHSKTLFSMMMEAAEMNSVFRFSVSYDHSGHPGFFVNAFNDLYGQWAVDETWWEILDGDLKRTPVGVSSYVPADGETMTFNFTQGWDH